MTSRDIRKKFLDFFKSKNHLIVPSAPIVNKNDPTLMFTNAGMNQFKDYFLGNQTPKHPRIADTQKCLRVSGKHNDLEEVGIDTYHHTMFEMLGNWSFGDYFKKEAIAWSWELLTEIYKLPKDRLYVTVFGGDKSENLDRDDESVEFWKNWISEDRILFGGKKDNFWEMGDQGPCGPCTEIHIDLRPESEVKKISGRDLVNKDNPQVIEIWNNVFIQYNRKADGTLEELPAKHVDTGMGLERLVRAIQGKNSNYDTDIFQPLIAFISSHAGIQYGASEQTDIAMRVLADHIRAISFVIADGQLPSNTKAGYVIRRILRRAVRYGYTFLNFKNPFLHSLVPLLASQFEDVFPELKAQENFVQKVIFEEELSFLRTLENGLKRLDQIKKELKGDTIDGKTVFELYDTYGFPADLTALLAKENNLRIDMAGFEKEMEMQRERSKKAASGETSDWVYVHHGDQTEFIGYDFDEATVHILKYRKVKQKDAWFYQLVLDVTPFYAESGGQVGDTGVLITHDDEIRITDTQKENELIVHIAEKLPKDVTATFRAIVDKKRRLKITNHHSATHLLHAALRKVLGTHVTQKGSLVNEHMLRFDFSHMSKLSDEEIKNIETLVNEKIRENIPLEERRNVPIEEAKKSGAMALFGEKYGDYVRVITFDKDFSVELCGGTHVSSTGQIGIFKLISETSVAAGVRRIEAVTGEGAEKFIEHQTSLLSTIKEILNHPADVVKSLHNLIEENKTLKKQIEQHHAKQTAETKKILLSKIEKLDDLNCIISTAALPHADAMKQLSFELRNEVPNLVLVLGSVIDEKPLLTVMLSDNLVKEKQLNASSIIKELSKEIKGGGGGQPFYATAGGKDCNGLQKAIAKAREMLNATV
ncbi:MAG: alanine--tRNA ligase [Cytophagaceae bacterium]|nr:alanine--tRNA ligase [Cytophagaceae bacterium]MDW8456544.1 alanine--tRNA ligase [Cytophagaceae bacterium]